MRGSGWREGGEGGKVQIKNIKLHQSKILYVETPIQISELGDEHSKIVFNTNKASTICIT